MSVFVVLFAVPQSALGVQVTGYYEVFMIGYYVVEEIFVEGSLGGAVDSEY